MIGVIGNGVVGSNTARMLRELSKREVYCYDKFKECDATLEDVLQCGIIFICLPTPMHKDGSIDLSYIHEVIEKIPQDRTVVIRSTVTPGTCDVLTTMYGHEYIFCPEFLTEAHPWQDTLDTNRVVLGMYRYNAEVAQLFIDAVPSADIIHLQPNEAEAYKYVCNIMLASQVAVSNDLYFALKAMGVEYENLQPYLHYDHRLGTHTKVPGPDGDYGYGGKCFPKDMGAFVHQAKYMGYKPIVLDAVTKLNDRVRAVKDWYTIAGAVSEQGYE